MYGQKFGQKLVMPLKIEKNRNGKKENRSSTMLEDWGEFILLIQTTEKTQKFSTTQEENWKDLWLPRCRVKDSQASWKRMQSRRLAMKRSSNKCMIVLLNLNLRDKEQNLCSPNTMRVTLQVKDYFDDTLQFGAQVYSDATSDENSGCKKPQWGKKNVKEWEKLENIPAWQLTKVWNKNEVIAEARNECCVINGSLSSQESGVGAAISEIRRSSRVPRRQCKRWLWSLRTLHWTRLVCVPDDCCKNNGRYRKITRLWWTSSWCSIRVHSGKIGGCSQIAQNFKIRMSRCFDTSSTTQMAKIMRENWTSRGILLEWNLYGHPFAGLLWERQFQEALL